MQTIEKPQKAKAIEAGQITTLGMDGEKYVYQRALVIDFDSPEQLRDAIAEGRVEFSFLE